jgi:signal transduction histidine kinase
VCTDAVDAGQDVRFSGQPGYIVQARPQALRRCLTNLIDNAVKYGHFAEVSLEHSRLQDQHTVHVLIRDGGPGIPEAYQQQVFEPFFRLETSRSRDSGGTGLGMTIAQNIAQQHQGTLQLSNLSPQGLEVRLSLPLQ